MTLGQPNDTVAIGMPVYNGERWLRQSLHSLLNQTRRDFTLVISDNASTDGTEAICRELAAEDPRIRYARSETNIGVFRNYDRAFLLTRSTYFKWASANDLCAPAFLDECIDALNANPAAVLAYPRTVLFTDDPANGEQYAHDPEFRDPDPVIRLRRVLSEIRLNNVFNGVYRAETLRRSSLNGIYMGSDIVLISELALSGEILRLPQFLFFRRMTTDAASASKDNSGRRQFFAGSGRDVHDTPTWDFHRQLLRVIGRGPLDPAQRLRALAYVGRRLWWSREELWDEVRRTARQSARQ